ncbi:MAG TPA: HNH endonuclease signature motif containing protein [Ktedonobacterales bacterium]
MTAPDTLTCSTCGQAKPLTEFDPRFVGKGTRINCAACRHEAVARRADEQWRAANAARRAAIEAKRAERAEHLAAYLAALDAERAAERQEWEREEEQRGQVTAAWLGLASVEELRAWERELVREEERFRAREREQRRQQWELEARWRKENAWERARLQLLGPLTAAGFIGYEEGQDRVIELELTLRDCGQTWANIKRDFFALRPPYRGSGFYRGDVRQRRGLTRVSQSVRERIYTEQNGCCYLCDGKLLPLSVWRVGPDGNRPYDLLPRRMRTYRSSPLPELDHKTPVTRGGTSEPDNLAYACKRCNNLKLYLTEDEYRTYPNNAISRLALGVGTIEYMLGLEGEGRYTFGQLAAAAAQ